MLLHSRLCAVVTAASSVLHVFMISSLHPWWLNLMIIVMVGVCLPCAVHIWRRPKVPALQQITIGALIMAVLHAGLMLFEAPGGHDHGTQHSAMVNAAEVGNTSTLGVIAVELLTALLASALLARIRRRAQRQPAGPHSQRVHVAAFQPPGG